MLVVSPQGQGADIREALQDELADAERSADDRELMPNPLCVDSDIACDDWQRKGECERNAAFMRQTCGLSCGFCKSRIEVRFPPPISLGATRDIVQSCGHRGRREVLADKRVSLVYQRVVCSGALCKAGTWTS